MKLPELQNTPKYTGLYVVDFGDHSGVGFTAAEVAELLDSEQFTDVQIYKIHRANPDGTMELKGIPCETFQLESGMFFYAADESAARGDFSRLNAWAAEHLPPGRCKVHLAHTGDTYVTALIYPAEYDQEFSQWLLDADYRTGGLVEAGVSAVKGYYDAQKEILDRVQHWPAESVESLRGQELFEVAKKAIIR